MIVHHFSSISVILHCSTPFVRVISHHFCFRVVQNYTHTLCPTGNGKNTCVYASLGKKSCNCTSLSRFLGETPFLKPSFSCIAWVNIEPGTLRSPDQHRGLARQRSASRFEHSLLPPCVDAPTEYGAPIVCFRAPLIFPLTCRRGSGFYPSFFF